MLYISISTGSLLVAIVVFLLLSMFIFGGFLRLLQRVAAVKQFIHHCETRAPFPYALLLILLYTIIALPVGMVVFQLLFAK